jgi:hypothetical protein
MEFFQMVMVLMMMRKTMTLEMFYMAGNAKVYKINTLFISGSHYSK